MSVEIRVPTTGNAGEDAVVIELRAPLGSTVTEGDVVAVLETAKASVDVEAPGSGTVLEVRCAEGDEVPEHSVLLVIGEPGEVSAPSPAPASIAAVAEELPSEPPPQTPATSERAHSSERIAASPRARLLAQRNGIELSTVSGSGPGGRIIIPDVLARKSSATSVPAPGSPAAKDARLIPASIQKVRGARKVTASRMTQSLQESAQLTLNRYVAADVLVAFSKRLRVFTEAKNLPKVSINDMVNFAVAQVLPQYPAANSHFSWEGIAQFTQVNLGVAVDTGTALVVPVIRNAHTLSLLELAEHTRTIAERARSGGLDIADMEDGTITVTNLGMFGVHWFTPVLNPPQSCIVGVGAVHQPTPDAPALLPLSFTFDHRALDGAEAARCLAAVSDALENIDALSTTLPATH